MMHEIMGDTIYIWSTNRNAILPMNTTTTTTGMVGTTPIYGTTNAMHFVPVAYSCTVQIATTPDGTIKNYQWEGNEGGCRRSARISVEATLAVDQVNLNLLISDGRAHEPTRANGNHKRQWVRETPLPIPPVIDLKGGSVEWGWNCLALVRCLHRRY